MGCTENFREINRALPLIYPMRLSTGNFPPTADQFVRKISGFSAPKVENGTVPSRLLESRSCKIRRSQELQVQDMCCFQRSGIDR